MKKGTLQVVASERTRKNIFIALFVFAILISLAGLLGITYTFLKNAAIATTVAERNPIENTFRSPDILQAEREQLFTGSIEASIQKALQEASNRIKAGQPILLLNEATALIEYDRVKFRLEAKRNALKKVRWDLDKNFFDLLSNTGTEKWRVTSLGASLEDVNKLDQTDSDAEDGSEKSQRCKPSYEPILLVPSMMPFFDAGY